jgi:hypothetical protein
LQALALLRSYQKMNTKARRTNFLLTAAIATLLAGCAQAPAQAPAPQQAQSSWKPGWMSDPATSCKVWAFNPTANDSVSWNGRCKEGLADGQGILLSYSKGVLVGGYEGNARDGKFVGRGVMWWANGTRYEGDWLEGLPNGRGVYVSNDVRYEGEFASGRRSGQGTLTTAIGFRYDGQWRDNRPNGKGVLTGPTFCIESEWQNGKPTGEGTVSFVSGGHYEGSFRDGKRSGRGSLTWPDGTRYVGSFADGKPDGQGVITWPDGSTYAGAFRDGKIAGKVVPAGAFSRTPSTTGKPYTF